VAHVSISDSDGIRTVALDRPPANAMIVELLEEIVEALGAAAADPPLALVLAGRDPFFSGGVDLKVVPGYGAEEQRRMVKGINEMAINAYGLPCPVVGAITGHAIAGGLVLALCCDLRVASVGGRYGLTEIKVGVPYPQAAIKVIQAELPAFAARRLVISNRLTDAKECVGLGVFDEAVPPDAVLPRALDLASELASMPADVYARAKRDLRGAALEDMRAGADRDPLLAAWVQ
jgi:enoyl-CoA hydratase/carnithine racemase